MAVLGDTILDPVSLEPGATVQPDSGMGTDPPLYTTNSIQGGEVASYNDYGLSPLPSLSIAPFVPTQASMIGVGRTVEAAVLSLFNTAQSEAGLTPPVAAAPSIAGLLPLVALAALGYLLIKGGSR